MIQLDRWIRVQKKVKKLKNGGCHIWTGGKNNSGHGVIMVQGTRFYVHRLAYMAAYGLIPEETEIHHTCHNPACVNSDHLEALTRKQHKQAHIKYDRPPPNECKHGHRGHYKKNSQGSWICKMCIKLSSGKYYENKKGRPRFWTFSKNQNSC